MIDRETVDKIIDAAEIVDVVSDFVTLRRRGSNYVGLCPFHNEKTPSFNVNPARNICHCFGCGKGGSPVNFIMEHEQLTYVEALRYLAKKYHIDIEERELTDEQRAARTDRESMLVLNEFACHYFEQQLHETDDGKDIGLTYFRDRGFSDETIKKFHLGYSPERSTALYQAAIKAGYNRKYLIETGLCIDDKRGGGFDRFRGRVMFPVYNVAGKVIAFGGRTLKNDPAKYFNSPESTVYVKNRELYGLFQAKRAIVKEDKCFLVEGYTDVISMHQAGIENVVASSGTSLTQGQIAQIHRFTSNVTVLYDGDSAGIHASLRGIDMLLAEGLNIKVLLLPDGEDPDSFARKHNATQFNQFIAENESDFISFKMKILLDQSEGDPTKRSAAIGDVVKSIAVIPDAITRSVYAKQCSAQLDIAEDVILREISKHIKHNKDEQYKQRQREQARQQRQAQGQQGQPEEKFVEQGENEFVKQPETPVEATESDTQRLLYPHEHNMAHYIAKYGFCYLCDTEYEDGEKRPTTVIEHVYNELNYDNMAFTTPQFAQLYEEGLKFVPLFHEDLGKEAEKLNAQIERRFKEETGKIDSAKFSLREIEKKENEIKKRLDEETQAAMSVWRQQYLEKRLCSHPDDTLRATALELVSEKYQLSKIHTRYAVIRTEQERLSTLVPEALYNWKNAIVKCQIKEVQSQLANAQGEEAAAILSRLQELYDLGRRLAKLIGERVVNPK
ncbi:MAG: DNA primase [Muribaculaceae bacterium]|nr:DNA primase [Muribaculaceae bacterium]